jgi:3-oxoacyl-[acyl-carrier protein] reductase
MTCETSSPLSLTGKTALVTGGSRGIGRAISLALARSGAFVAINYLKVEPAAAATLESIKELGGDGLLAPFDVTNAAAVEDAAGRLLQTRPRIDILVNNAGITRDGLAGRMKDAEWGEVVSTNLTGAFNVCRTVAKTMIRNRAGRIVNVASTAGEAGNAGQANYSAAKAGLIGFTKALARELAPRNILVNAVSPGIIDAGMSEHLQDSQKEAIVQFIPLRRPGKSGDVAHAVLFLCSDMAEYITGQVIRVNGGLYM